MIFSRLVHRICFVAGLALFAVASFAQRSTEVAVVPPTAIIQTITFEGLGTAEQAAVAGRMTVEVGDTLSYETRQRIAEDLKVAGKKLGLPLTFSYHSGTKQGTALLTVKKGC